MSLITEENVRTFHLWYETCNCLDNPEAVGPAEYLLARQSLPEAIHPCFHGERSCSLGCLAGPDHVVSHGEGHPEVSCHVVEDLFQWHVFRMQGHGPLVVEVVGYYVDVLVCTHGKDELVEVDAVQVDSNRHLQRPVHWSCSGTYRGGLTLDSTSRSIRVGEVLPHVHIHFHLAGQAGLSDFCGLCPFLPYGLGDLVLQGCKSVHIGVNAAKINAFLHCPAVVTLFKMHLCLCKLYWFRWISGHVRCARATCEKGEQWNEGCHSDCVSSHMLFHCCVMALIRKGSVYSSRIGASHNVVDRKIFPA